MIESRVVESMCNEQVLNLKKKNDYNVYKVEVL